MSNYALITGGTKGLGLATAKVFAQSGKSLILAYRSDQQAAEKARVTIEALGVKCHTIALDMTDAQASTHLQSEVSKITPSLSVYIHNAAATSFKPLMEVKPHHFQKTYCLTVLSFIQNVQWIVPMMSEGGSIVTVSGLDTKEAVPFHGLLASAKSSLEMLTSYFAHELAGKKIQVNGVNPGYLETESMEKYLGPMYEHANKMIASITPGKKNAKLEDVANIIEFLTTEKAQWIFGQTIQVDGGQTFSSFASILMRAKT